MEWNGVAECGVQRSGVAWLGTWCGVLRGGVETQSVELEVWVCLRRGRGVKMERSVSLRSGRFWHRATILQLRPLKSCSFRSVSP